jgi:hypothetical protein
VEYTQFGTSHSCKERRFSSIANHPTFIPSTARPRDIRIWWCTQVAVAHDTQGLACIPAKMNTDHMIMWPTENRVALRVATATVSLDM